MSEEQNETGEAQATGPAYDVYLDTLLEFLDQEETKGSSLTVTLMVGGALVCGDLISHDQWQDELQAVLRGAGGNGQLLGKLLKTVDTVASSRPEGEPLHFVHLRNAMVITNYRATLQGSTPQGMEHPVWRGRLSEVQGWTLGRPA